MSAAPHASRQVPAPKDRAKIISAIKKLVPERHINVSNPNQDYRPWIALVDERLPRLIELDDAQAFESGVGELPQSTRQQPYGLFSSAPRQRPGAVFHQRDAAGGRHFTRQALDVSGCD